MGKTTNLYWWTPDFSHQQYEQVHVSQGCFCSLNFFHLRLSWLQKFINLLRPCVSSRKESLWSWRTPRPNVVFGLVFVGGSVLFIEHLRLCKDINFLSRKTTRRVSIYSSSKFLTKNISFLDLLLEVWKHCWLLLPDFFILGKVSTAFCLPPVAHGRVCFLGGWILWSTKKWNFEGWGLWVFSTYTPRNSTVHGTPKLVSWVDVSPFPKELFSGSIDQWGFNKFNFIQRQFRTILFHKGDVLPGFQPESIQTPTKNPFKTNFQVIQSEKFYPRSSEDRRSPTEISELTFLGIVEWSFQTNQETIPKKNNAMILLMVQKSHSQPPGMVLKPCK